MNLLAVAVRIVAVLLKLGFVRGRLGLVGEGGRDKHAQQRGKQESFHWGPPRRLWPVVYGCILGRLGAGFDAEPSKFPENHI